MMVILNGEFFYRFLCYSDKAFESANRYTHPDRKRKEKNLDSYRERLKIANSNHFLRLYTELCINRGKVGLSRSRGCSSLNKSLEIMANFCYFEFFKKYLCFLNCKILFRV